MTDKDKKFERIAQRHIADLKKSSKAMVEDAAVRVAEPPPEFIDALKYDVARRDSEKQCRTDGRCQYAIDSGAEGLGHCPKGKCVMPAEQKPVECETCNGRGMLAGYAQDGSFDGEDCPDCTPPPQRKPLTNGEIYTAYITATNQTLRAQDERLAFAFARAIEAAVRARSNT